MENEEAVKIFVHALLTEIRYECRNQHFQYDADGYIEYRLKQAAEWLVQNSRT